MSAKDPKRSYLIILAAVILPLLVGLLIYLHNHRLKPCGDPPFGIPTIQEVTGDRVFLGNNGQSLSVRDIYQFNHGNMKLIDINQDRLSFIYERKFESPAGEGGYFYPVEEFRCKLNIDRDDVRFQPTLYSLLPQPGDFTECPYPWFIDHYTEYVIPEEFHIVPPEEEIHLHMEGGHINDSTYTQSIYYDINVEISLYDSATAALDAAATDKRRYDKWQISPAFEARADSYAVGCALVVNHVCAYVGQYGNDLLEVVLVLTEENPPGTYGIPAEDWQYVVSLAESKIIIR